MGKASDSTLKTKKTGAARRRSNGGVRIQEVAKLAGVGAMTVSRAINNPSTVSPEKRKAIEAAIKKTGYVPNFMAGSLRSNRSKIIAVLNPTMKTSIFSDLTQGMWDVLQPEGYQLLLGSTSYSLDREEQLVRAFLSQQADGVVLTAIDHTPACRALLRENDIAVVETFDLAENPIDMVVGFSAFDAAAEMAAYLAGQGYRKIGLIAAPGAADKRAKRRIDGFTKGLKEAGLGLLKRRRYDVSDLTTRAGADAIGVMMAKNPDVDAIFCTNDLLAVGAVMECQRRGWDVPSRVAIAGFGDIDIASVLHPRLTTVRLSGYDMGVKTARLLLAKLGGEPVPEKTIDMGFEIIRRESA